MKILKTATFLLLAAGILVSCSKSEPDTDKGFKLTAKATTTNEPETRMGYNEGVSSMSFTWEDYAVGDKEKFSAFVENGDNTPITFTQIDAAGTSNGTFSGVFQNTPQVGKILYAIYPKLADDVTYTPTALPLDLHTQKFATSPEALKSNASHYMLATATYAGSDQLNFNFNHKVSILKVEMTLPVGTAAIKTLRLAGVHTGANLDITTGVLSFNSTDVSEIVMTDATGFSLVGNKLTAYIYLLPQDLSSKKLTLKAVDANNKLYEIVFNGRNIEAGKLYTLATTLNAITQIRIGDFYLTNDTWITREVFSLTANEKLNCAGIVFAVNLDGSGKILGLKEPTNKKITWSPIGAILATNDLNGMLNMHLISLILNWAVNYPVFMWADSNNAPNTNYLTATTDVWYLPSSKELRQLYAAMSGLKWIESGTPAAGEIVDWGNALEMPNYANYSAARANFNALLIAAGSTEMSGFYWSSTQTLVSNNSLALDFDSGLTNQLAKTTDQGARVVLTFQLVN